MNISVIVPTYNRPKALKLCLLSLAGQSVLPSEVLIADDGSGQETRDMVHELQSSLKHRFPIKHVWQEDVGFRKPRILNETVRQAAGDYLVFIDGDCMAHRHFIKAHRDYSAPDAVLSGKRVEIGEHLTAKLLDRGKVMNRFNFVLLWDSARRQSRRVAESIQIKNPWLRQAMHRDRIYNDGVWGCNFSLYRDLFSPSTGATKSFWTVPLKITISASVR
jgi:glycosyltransferase involved in cell wall biosynthesis